MTQPSNPLDHHAIAGTSYGFSAVRIADLGATEYTLVGIAADASASVQGWADQIEDCIAEVARSCGCSPRADNLLCRVAAFDHRVHEVHGFRPLGDIDPDRDYRDTVRHGGSTALYDASLNAIAAVRDYAEQLDGADFECNGIVFVVTDGADNASTAKLDEITDALERATKSGHLDSMLAVLVGVGTADPGLRRHLDALHKKAGFSAFIEIDRADAKHLAQLARFVSKSIALQSRALGTAGPGAIGF
jgi:hypothetical protein